VRYDPARRERVAGILERQNRSWNASAQTLDNLARLRAGARAVVTGQQVALFGGPLFSMLKAVTAIKLAEETTRAGIDTVPVFWLATDDHDLAEIDHVLIPASDGSPTVFRASTHGAVNAPVGRVELASDIAGVIEGASQYLNEEVVELLRTCYRPGQSLGNAFGQLFSLLFKDWGIVLVDASDPELHAVSEPILSAAIQADGALNASLLERGREIEAAGFLAQVKVTDSSTLLFGLENGSRVPVRRRPGTASSPPEFIVGERNVRQEELVERVRSAPEEFSPNVLLRPVVEDYLLPTIAYVGGAAEISYFAQAGIVYERLIGRITPSVFRLSATLLDSKANGLLDKYHLRLSDVLAGGELLREKLTKQALSEDIQEAFSGARVSVKGSLERLRQRLEPLDKTLVEAASHAESKMQYQLDQLLARAARAELRQAEILGRHAQFLTDTLYPNQALQERAIAGVYFLSRHGRGILKVLHDAVNPDCLDHQIISM
jgi:bacillithiol biosynthesis cysteine-adding enzyme BshC